MARTIRSQVQRRLPPGPLALAALWLSCAPTPQPLVSSPFRLDPRQVARLTVRRAVFCAGQPGLTVTLSFTNDAGNTVARREAVLACGGSAQLDLTAGQASGKPVTARLDLPASAAYPIEAAVEVITPAGSGREGGVLYRLRKPAAPGPTTQCCAVETRADLVACSRCLLQREAASHRVPCSG